MYERTKTILKRYPYSVPCILAIVCIALVWGIASWRSHVDTTGIRGAEKQLQRSLEYNEQSIDYNRRATTAIERSADVNERIETAVTNSVEATRRTEEAINRSESLVTKARADAIRAKDLAQRSRDILESAERRNKETPSESKEQHNP